MPAQKTVDNDEDQDEVV